MDRFKIPDSPPLPKQETDAPETRIPAQLGSELDLGDDDDDDDEGDVRVKREEDVDMADELPPGPGPATVFSTGRAPQPINNFEQFEHTDSLPATPEDLPGSGAGSCAVPQDPNYVTPMMDFSDPVRPPLDLLNPFGANNTLSSSDPIPITLSGSGSSRRLSDLQQQKVSEYIDDRLLGIQRGFVKYLSSKEEADLEGLAWEQIAARIDEVVEFVWYALFHVTGVPAVYHSNVLADECIRAIFDSRFPEIKTRLDASIRPCQHLLVRPSADAPLPALALPATVDTPAHVSFLIKLSGDLIDYIVKYDFASFTDWIVLLRLAAKLDNVLSVLVDYSALPTTPTLVSTTDKVRLASIVQRTKIAVVELFDRFVRHLDPAQAALHQPAIDHFQGYAGETYEGLVDRTSV